MLFSHKTEKYFCNQVQAVPLPCRKIYRRAGNSAQISENMHEAARKRRENEKTGVLSVPLPYVEQTRSGERFHRNAPKRTENAEKRQKERESMTGGEFSAQRRKPAQNALFSLISPRRTPRRSGKTSKEIFRTPSMNKFTERETDKRALLHLSKRLSQRGKAL